MAEGDVPDEQVMISYLSAVRDFFKHENHRSTRAKTGKMLQLFVQLYDIAFQLLIQLVE